MPDFLTITGSQLSTLHIERPFLLLLLAIPFIYNLLQKTLLSNTILDRFADPSMLKHILIKHPSGYGHRRQYWQYARHIAWLLAIVAASGPIINTYKTDIERSALDIALVFDLSPSMALSDIQPNRLERGKIQTLALLQNLMDSTGQHRFSISAFSANAYQVLPLTHDLPATYLFVSQLQTGLSRAHGSNLTGALELAIQSLANSHQRSRAIILISDGDIHDASGLDNIAQRLHMQHIPLFTLATGTEPGAPARNEFGHIFNDDGKAIMSRLNNTLLEQLARSTSGLSFSATENDAAIQLNHALSKLPHQSRYQAAVQEQQPVHHLFLALALMIFLITGLRKHPVILPLLLILPVIPNTGHANPWQQQAAFDAFQQRDYLTAELLYRNMNNFDALLARGNIAYINQDFKQATRLFTQAQQQATSNMDRAKASYNLGNTLTQSQQTDAAISAYKQALLNHPTHKKAAYNMSLITQWQASLKQGIQQEDAERGNQGEIETDQGSYTQENHTQENHKSEADKSETGNSDTSNNNIGNRARNTMTVWQASSDTNNNAGLNYQMQQLKDNIHTTLTLHFASQDSNQPGRQSKEDKPW